MIETNTYNDWLSKLTIRYRQSQIKAATAVNIELLKFYWELGADILRLEKDQPWGSGFIDKLASDIQQVLPDGKAFSRTKLYYIRSFREIYQDIIVPQLEGQLEHEIFRIPWGHHKCLIDKFKKDPKQALFYVRETLKNGWSRAVLLNFIDTDLYSRQGKAISNFALALPNIESDLAQEITKDPYDFSFLTLDTRYREKDLKSALLTSVEKFLLELGQGFMLVGREYRLEVGQKEKFADLLFFHMNLNAYVVVEVKITEFEAEHLGQLGLYVSAVNHLLKKPEHAPTIGLLICKTKDNILAKWALESTSQPIGVSEYRLTKLPSVAEIEDKLK